MEVKINREIRDYTESMFFGLSMRQFFFSVAAVGVAVLLYFLLKPHFGTETVSWMCILGAAPFAALGFFKYHGMTAEKFLLVWIRSELLEPKRYTFKPTNLYAELMKDERRKQEKGDKKDDEIDSDQAPSGEGDLPRPEKGTGPDPDKEGLS